MIKAVSGVNDLVTWCKNNNKTYIIDEWDFNKNNRSPDTYTKGSNQKVFWICPIGHSYDMAIYYRTTNNGGCPYCKSERLLVGFNDLATKRPDLLEFWDYEKNSNSPSDVMPGSNKKAFWHCKQGHHFESKICHVSDGHGCPYCHNQKPVIGVNDLKTLYPHIAAEWDYNKNPDPPEAFLPFSNLKAFWICSKGHSWSAVISSRTKLNRGCPGCKGETQTSFAEQALYYYLKKHYDIVLSRDRQTIGAELDIYVPCIKTAIEFDGAHWHANRDNKDESKNKICQNLGIRLIRLCEKRRNEFYIVDFNDSTKQIEQSYHDIKEHKLNCDKLDDAIGKLTSEYLGFNSDVDLSRDCARILSQYIYCAKDNNLALINPTLAKEWDYEKNLYLSPDMFTPSSNKKVNWKCEKGHEFKASINDRNRGRRCPYCARKKALSGYNTLDITDPELVEEFDLTKNKKKPNKILRGSDEKYWWECKQCGYSWQASVSSRACAKRGCPKCGIEKNVKKRQKAVINLDTGEIYESASAAQKKTGIGCSNIRNCCLKYSNTAGGFRWSYYENV